MFVGGPVYTGNYQLTPGQKLPTQGASLTMLDDTQYGNGPAFGEGTIVISEDGSATQYNRACPLSKVQTASNTNALTQYVNGYCQAQATVYPDKSNALMVYQDVFGRGVRRQRK